MKEMREFISGEFATINKKLDGHGERLDQIEHKVTLFRGVFTGVKYTVIAFGFLLLLDPPSAKKALTAAIGAFYG